jgi:hypothetical protein
MVRTLRGAAGLLGRLLLSGIFLMSAAAHGLDFTATVEQMRKHDVPSPEVLLPAALACLALGACRSCSASRRASGRCCWRCSWRWPAISSTTSGP